MALPLAQVADACALPQEFLRQGVQRARDLQAAVETLLAEMTRWHSRYPAPDSSPAHQALSQWVHSWTLPLREGAQTLVHDLSAVSATSGFPAEQAAAVAEDMLERLGEFRSWPTGSRRNCPKPLKLPRHLWHSRAGAAR
ncbi:hypothetical protein ACFQV4_30660 [Streptomyces thermocarboxydus]